jgi:ATP-dependent DNA helicase RecG
MTFKVFISGNQRELKKERFAVKEAIEKDSILDEYFDVFLFEELPAAGKDPVSSFLTAAYPERHPARRL